MCAWHDREGKREFSGAVTVLCDFTDTNAPLFPTPLYHAVFRLQAKTNLATADNWTSVTQTPVAIGNRLVVTNPMTGPRNFYRLVNP